MSISPSVATRHADEGPPDGAQPTVPVLLVDDDANKRLALRSILRPLGYDIVEADSGLAALREVMTQDFAVILLDVRMPLMDGFETAALIRQRWQCEMTPIIFITAYATDEIKNADRYAQGAVDFISAPVIPDELRAKVSAFGAIFRNATALAARASDVQASADQLRLLTEAAPIGIFQTDTENRYVYTNPRWSEITGVSAEEALGQVWETILGEEPKSVGMPDGQSELSHRFELPAGPGAPRIVLVTSKVIPAGDHGLGGWVGTLADVTAEAGAEAAMAEARDAATAASQLKSDFLANMSHEIRTPMNGVIGMTDLLLETDLDLRQRDYAQTVRNSGEALMTIINDLLDFSKVEAGMLEPEQVEFSLRTIVDDAVDMLAGPAQAKGLDLIPVIAKSVPAAVIGDPGRVRQVLTNLLGNAIKFTQSGEIVVRVSELEQVGAERVIRFEVSDTGVGIAADKLASIFNPFVQADTSTSRKYGGTGLGLAICSQLSALMNGDCGVSSRLGVGSDFWFTVRVLAISGSVAPDLGPADSDLAGVAALVVDDSASQREVLRDYMTDWGMSVATADSDETAVAALRSAAIDDSQFGVVLAEGPLGPGGLTGAVNGAPSTGPSPGDGDLSVPIVLMTRLGEEPALASTDGSGVRATLSKPIHREELRGCLQVAIGLPGADSATAVEASMRPASAGSGTAGRLLLAEDNLINRKVAFEMLFSAGYHVDTVRDGVAAVAAAATRPYDAILMDCQMPEMNGYEAAAAIRAREGTGGHTPIIALTAGASREERTRCLAEGMDAYLSKPVGKDALVALVGQWVKFGSGPEADDVARSVAAAPPLSVEVPEAPQLDETVSGGEMASLGAPELIAPEVLADLEHLDGNPLPRLLALFFNEANGLMSELRVAVDGGHALTVSRVAHRLKGGSATIGAAGVAHIAGALVTTARAGDLSGAGELLDRLRRALAQTEAALTGGVDAA